MTNDIDTMFQILELDSDDWPTYCVLADVYDDIGLTNEADCLRWMASMHKRPLKAATRGGWCWFRFDRFGILDDPASSLPLKVWGTDSREVLVHITCRSAIGHLFTKWNECHRTCKVEGE